MRYLFNVALVFWLAATPVHAQTGQPDTEAIFDEIIALNWTLGPSQRELASLNAAYELSADEAMVEGLEARRYLELTQGTSEWDDVQFVSVVVDGPAANTQTIYSHHDIGYIHDDDWSEIDPSDLLDVIRQNTREGNKERRANGYPTLKIQGWLQKPAYDKDLDTAYWAVSIQESTSVETVNAVALKLSRDGFSKIIWVGHPAQFQGEKTLRSVGNSYQFKRGNRYADFSTGDVVAGVGLAALTTGIITGKGWKKTAGAGLAALLLAFAKKLWFLILIPFLWIGKLFKRPT